MKQKPVVPTQSSAKPAKAAQKLPVGAFPTARGQGSGTTRKPRQKAPDASVDPAVLEQFSFLHLRVPFDKRLRMFERARELKMSVSAYVQYCAAREMGEGSVASPVSRGPWAVIRGWWSRYGF
jgi:hypothetical protein